MSESATAGEKSPQRRRISLDLIDRMEPSRSLNEENVVRLQGSIEIWGLMQPIVVIMAGLRYLLCIGNHRCEAMLRSGEAEVDALVLPEGTTPEEALMRSLHENHVRHDESLRDIMKRVTALKDYHGCKSFAEAAELASISEAQLSKIKFAMETFNPQGLSLIHEHQIGPSVAYEIAKCANGVEEQLEWLAAHARGEMGRDDIVAQTKRKAAAKRAKRAPSQRKLSPLRICGVVGGVGLQLTFAPDQDGEFVARALATVVRQLAEHVNAARPLSEFAISGK